MPGHKRSPFVHQPTIPLGSLVRDRKTGRLGVLVSYGSRAARVKFDPKKKWTEWATIVHLEVVSPEEIAELLKKEAEGLV